MIKAKIPVGRKIGKTEWQLGGGWEEEESTKQSTGADSLQREIHIVNEPMKRH